MKSILTLLAFLVSTSLQAMTLEEELAEFRSIGNTYLTAWDKSESAPEAFIALVRAYPAKARWYQETYAKYRAETEAGTDLGKAVFSAAKGAKTGIDTFLATAGEFAAAYPGRFKELIEKAKGDAAMAESEKTPGYYRAALDTLDRAEWMVTVLVAFNGEADPIAKQCAKGILELRSSYESKEAALIRATARVVKAPEEIYRGEDLETLRAGVTAAWNKAHPTDRVIAVVFDQADWKLNRFSRWHETDAKWDHIDKSFLEVSVVVEKDAKNALIHAAFVNRDNATGEITFGVDTKGGSFVTDEIGKDEL
jgi:hypothetical protein